MNPHPSPDVGPRYTLGVVIPVPEPQRALLRRWRAHYGAADSALIYPHVTLVTRAHPRAWGAAADPVRAVAAASAAFEVRLRAAASFRPDSEVVSLPLEAGLGECLALHAQLLRGPLRHASHFAYHPHLTIAQNVGDARLDAAQTALHKALVEFTVRHVQLYDMAGETWNLREQIPLGSG